MELIVPEWTAPPNVGALSTTRCGGYSPAPYDDGTGAGGMNLGTHVGDAASFVARNRARLRMLLPNEPAWLSQVHGTVVLDAEQVANAPEADASIATRPGFVCVVQTADCLPVLFCDRRGTVVGAAHAGWRGLAGGVLDNTAARMRAAGAREILAWMGPAIGPQCFEVGPDVFAAFCARDPAMTSAFTAIEDRPGKYLADIYALARSTLRNAGVDEVFGGGLCTVTDTTRFYSYRRDKVTGRMASLIWLK